jgi:predicted GIY-YIG superfamily endonuclease
MIVYVLRLKDNRFYIAKTVNIKKCYQEHMNGTACEWTRKYQPLIVERIIPNARDEMVDILVDEYVLKYGKDHVRGGKLQDETESPLFCNHCNVNGHEVVNCPLAPPSEPLLNPESMEYMWTLMKRQESYVGCYRCGRLGHNGWDCFASMYQ